MQLNSIYLYSNKLDVFTNVSASWTSERYRRVYNRNLKIYKGVDNRVDFQVKNSDEKKANTVGSNIKFNIIARETQDLIYSKDCTVLSAIDGRYFITITEAEMLDLEAGFYNLTMTQELRSDINDEEYIVTSRNPLYVDSQYGVIGTLEVIGDVLGTVDQSLIVDKFSYINPAALGEGDPKFYISSIIDASQTYTSLTSLSTFQFYFDNYNGTVVIQGSIDEQGATPKNWVDVVTLQTTNDLEYTNIVGKWNWFRIKHTPAESNTGTLDKILFR